MSSNVLQNPLFSLVNSWLYWRDLDWCLISLFQTLKDNEGTETNCVFLHLTFLNFIENSIQHESVDPNTLTSALHLLLILFTNLATRACGMAFHSSTRIRRSSANIVRSVTLCLTDLPSSWSYNRSIELRSGLFAGHSILSTPSSCNYSLTTTVLSLLKTVNFATFCSWHYCSFMMTAHLMVTST